METVLVVDDDPRLRLMLREQLELAGFTVDEAAEGQGALARVAAGDVALVLLDVMMPGEDGLAVLKRLREQEGRARLPVILLTARSQMGEKLHGLEAGADDYITKPFDPAELLARVRAQLRLRRLSMQLEERNEELQRFAAAVAHEVRAPLNEVGLHLDQASAFPLPAEVQAALQAAEAALQRTSHVLEIHLQVARAGHVPEPRETLSLLDLLREAEDQIRVTLALPAFEVRLSGTPGPALGNATLLGELFRNLLENAVRHGGARAGLLVTFTEEGDKTRIDFEDGGPGVSPERLPTLFSPFRSSGGGSGLGLVIARRIARGHGGELSYETGPGAPRFVVWLPRVGVGAAK